MPVKKTPKRLAAESVEPEFRKKPLSGSKKKYRSDTEIKMDRELKQIYANGDGSLPNMRKIEKQKSGGLVRGLIGLLFFLTFLGAVAWVGFFFFQPQAGFSETDVALAITGESAVVSGQEIHYRLRFSNDQNVPLTKVSLQVRYPQGFVFASSTPAALNDKNDEWTLGALEERGENEVEIWGKIYGDLGEKQSLRAFLNYIPANFSAEFQKVATLETVIAEPAVSLSISGSDQVQSGNEVEYVVTLENKQTESVENLALSLLSNDLFTLKSADPLADKDNQTSWSIASLTGKKEIKIRGVFSPTEINTTTLTFALRGWLDNKRSDEGNIVNTVVKEIGVKQTNVVVNLAINGTLSDLSVQPGDTLHISLAVKNLGQEAVDNVVVKAILDAPAYQNKSILNWPKIVDEKDGRIAGEKKDEQSRRGAITWDATLIPALKHLEAQQEIIIDFSLPIKTAAEIDLTSFANYLITAFAEVRYDKNKVAAEPFVGNPVVMTINSDTVLKVEHEVNTLNSKPKHVVSWVVNNNFHELKDISLTADFYGDIDWLADSLVVPAGRAEFSRTDKRLTWTVASMPTSLDVLALQFAFVLNAENPSQTKLSSPVKFKATDVITGQEIILAGDEMVLNGGVE